MSCVFLSQIKYPLSPINGQRIHVPSHDQDSSHGSNSIIRNKKRGSRGRGDEDDNDDDIPQSKRGRMSKFHEVCSPCSIWQQSGSDPNLQSYHKVSNKRNMRYPGNDSDATKMSRYVSFENVSIALLSDSCICDGCQRDFERNKNNENSIPRWVKIKREFYLRASTRNKHCVLCCTIGEQCVCHLIDEWGPESWYQIDNIETWRKYLQDSGIIDHQVPRDASHVCKNHFRAIRKLVNARKCGICSNSFNDSWWKLVSEVGVELQEITEAFGLSEGSLKVHDWVCKHCRLYLTDKTRLCNVLEADTTSTDHITRKRAEIVKEGIEKIRHQGISFTSDIINEFKASVPDDQEHSTKGLVKAFSYYLHVAMKKHSFSVYTPGTKRFGQAYFDKNIFTEKSVPYVFNQYTTINQLKAKLEKVESNNLNQQKVQQLVKEQAKAFPATRSFDYRTFVTEQRVMDDKVLDSFFKPDLIKLVENITTSDHGRYRPHSELYKQTRKMKVRMIVALLCNTMNPQSCFMQTFLGLYCYCYGLRDAGFEVLNAFGCTCSIDHLRQHGEHWATHRQAISELKPTHLWRVSFDNLNFKMKYAKKLSGGGGDPGAVQKMLNLLTGQVTTRTMQSDFPLDLRCSRDSKNVSQSDLFFDETSETDHYILLFNQTVYNSTTQRLACTPQSCQESLIASFQKTMPHWTSKCADNVVFTTVDEAQSGTDTDVESYLLKLKHDLKITEQGYPSQVLLAGDQQTYAILKKIKKRYPERFNWFIAVHGDWHLMKLTAELLQDLLWDGGLKQFTERCGYKHQLYKWQELHLMLVATYEAFMRKAVRQYTSIHSCGESCTANHSDGFWKWLQMVGSSRNQDQVSQFWATTLFYLHAYVGYYFSIRSGNWLLRNSCLKLIAPMFFCIFTSKI